MSSSVRFDGWCIVTGQDFRQKFFIKDPTLPKIPNPDFNPKIKEDARNSKEVFQPKDLTGYTAKMDIRVAKSRDSDALAELESGSGITIGSPDPTDGSIEIFIDNTVTNQDPILSHAGKDAYYDIFLIKSGADTQRLFSGTIGVEGSVTDV